MLIYSFLFFPNQAFARNELKQISDRVASWSKKDQDWFWGRPVGWT